MDRVDHGLIVASAHGLQRSPKWRAAARRFLSVDPFCACCGGRVGVQVHHRWPFHDCVLAGRPDLELDAHNFIALCETDDDDRTDNCHLYLGHLGDWRSYNPDVVVDTKRCMSLSRAKRLATVHDIWPNRKRPRSYPDMSTAEKQAFRRMLDQAFPLAS